jgi:hypothetical protein
MNRKRELRDCPHCHKPFDISGWQKHMGVCLANPNLFVRLRTFMRENNEGGYIMGTDRYDDLHGRMRFPGRPNIRQQLGSWANFAAWCGLRHAAVSGPTRHSKLPRTSNIRIAAIEGLPVYEARRCIRAWDVKGHCYVPVGWQRVWAVR